MAVAEDGFDGLALVAHLVEESVAASRVGQRHAGADEQDWNRVGEGLQQRGQGIEDRRSRRRHDDLHRSGDAGSTVCHISGTLLMPRRDDVDSLGRQLREDLKVVGPGDPEDTRDAFGPQCTSQVRPAGDLFLFLCHRDSFTPSPSLSLPSLSLPLRSLPLTGSSVPTWGRPGALQDWRPRGTVPPDEV